ncbi:MAG TPA: amidase [Longimicrobiales bacterium]
MINRRIFIARAAALSVAASVRPATAHAEAAQIPDFELDEITIAQLQAGMQTGRYTARSIAQLYLQRIEAIDRNGPMLRAVIETNPDALRIADALDRERGSRRVRGPLHGIPVLVKDNIDTADRMLTTAGSLALVGAPAPRDAFIAQRLRQAGAVILGKTNLSEWANFRSSHSSSGWSGRGGQCRNPYVLDRNPCGSSSGTGAAVSANLAALGVGTETDGSIVCPSNANGLVGIKPTIGLVSRSGIIPISHNQDTAGPMARTVTDAALLLSALSGIDATDQATLQSRARSIADYTQFLDAGGLKGARIGVARARFFGYSEETDALVNAAIDAMKQAGAVIVDPADIPHVGEYDDSEFTVLLYDFKADLEAYLRQRGATTTMKTLNDLIAFNEQNKERELPYFQQEIFHQAQAKGPLSSKEYVDALGKNLQLSRAEGIDAVMAQHKLDALVAPTGSPAWPTDLINGDHFLGASSTPAAVAGYPSISLPVGYSFGLPVGISFIGRAWSEGILIKLAYALEQTLHVRRKPDFRPTLVLE